MSIKQVKKWRNQTQAGMSIIEIMLAMAVFSVLAAVLLSLVWEPLVSSGSSTERIRAVMLAEEGLDAARSIRNDSWLNLTSGSHGLGKSGGQWIFSGVNDMTDIYTRTITVEEVNRDVDGDIVEVGGTIDARTKKVTSTVAWESAFGGSKSLFFSSYFTNWNVYDWTQASEADFSGGAHNGTTVVGSGEEARIELGAGGTGGWVAWSGSSVTHTSDADYSTGTVFNTIISGDGLELDTGALTWQTVDSPTNKAIYAVDVFAADSGWAVGDSEKFHYYDGSSWSEFLDSGNDKVFAVQMLSASSGWAGGKSGKLFRYDGSSWSEFQDMGHRDVNDIHMWSASSGWAVADKGEMYYFNGTSWSEEIDLGQDDVYGVDMVTDSDAWSVGESGKFYHYNGTTWSQSQDLGNDRIYDVDMLSAGDGWAVGASGKIYHYNGTSWSQHTVTGSDDLYGVYMISASDGWAVGENGVIYRWNGTSWQSQASPTSEDLRGIDIVSTDPYLGWAVGDGGTIIQLAVGYAPSGTFTSGIIDSGKADTVWDSVAWTETLPDNTDITIAVRSGNTATPDGSWSAWSSEVTDSGGSDITVADSRYLQYRVTMTTAADTTPRLEDITITYDVATPNNLYGVSGSAIDDVWAVGGDGGTLIHFDGSSWSSFVSPTGNTIYAVDTVAADDAWAVADSEKFLHWDGSSWTEADDTGSGTLYDIDMLSASSGWAVGSGEEFFYYDGSSWSKLYDLGGKTPYAIEMLSATEGWAAGSSGKFYRYNGSAWVDFDDLGNDTIYDLDMINSAEGWAVGESGKFYRWNGSSWFEYDDVGSVTLYGVAMVSAVQGWAVGEGGALYEWDGNDWLAIESGVTEDLRGVKLVAVSPVEAWAVGLNGTLLKYTAGYSGSGTYTSSVLNTDSENSVWEVVFFTTVTPGDSTATVAFRSGDTATPDESWSAWSSEIALTSGVSIPVSDAQYLQYRVSLDKNTSPDSPAFDDITVTYTQ